MHAFILAGGRGSRLVPLTDDLPKGLVKIGGFTLLDLIIHHLRSNAIESIYIAGGYQVQELQQHFQDAEGVCVIDTGLQTNTGGRIKQLFETVNISGSVLICWCDALTDLQINRMHQQHLASKPLVTLAAVHPTSKFGELELDKQQVRDYREKPVQKDRWISGGYFIVDSAVADRIEGNNASWETDVITRLSAEGRLEAYRHEGNWQCVDTEAELRTIQSVRSANNHFWGEPS